MAISTHGEANRQCWTSLSPLKTRHCLDDMIAHQTDEDHGKVRVDYRALVGLSGFRDHRPLVARVKKPTRWNRTLVGKKYRVLLNWERAAQTGYTVHQCETRTLRLPADIVVFVEKKQRFVPRWRGCRRLCEKEQLTLLYKSQPPVVKGAVRVTRGGTRWRSGTSSLPRRSKTYAMVKQ